MAGGASRAPHTELVAFTIMRITIGFHDVVEETTQAQPIGAGFTTLYTLDRTHFRNCLTAIQRRLKPRTPGRVDESEGAQSVFLTVDDGMESSITIIAPELERLGWRGHFFITTDWIGRPGFMNERQIRELDARRHVIGSHSCSHPKQMWSMSPKQLLQEWGDSRRRLSDVLGHDVAIASVPGGYYSTRVAVAADACGYRILFTSEPTAKIATVNLCRVLGRYTVRRHTPSSTVADMAAGAKWNRWKQTAAWAATKTAKRVAGKWYLPLRRVLVESRPTHA